jgi:NAD(P)-dependent dehydrogenase (short-subunit alcohol dehydrogenase family)
MSRTIVITGAGSGLGRALARRFAAEGETLVLLGRTRSKVEAVAAEIGGPAMAVECDVASPESVRSAFATIAERHPKIDVLINNAAVFEPFLVAEARDDQILDVIATNLTGPILCVRAAIPMLGPGAHVINVSSEVVSMPNYPFMTLYQTSKAGLERFSQALACELEADGVRVTTVRAGSMMDADSKWDLDPAVAVRFREAAAAAGVNLATKPISQFASVTGVFRAILDLPPDVTTTCVAVEARRP